MVFSCKKEVPKTEADPKPEKVIDTVKPKTQEAVKPQIPSLVFTVQIGAYKMSNPDLTSVKNIQIQEENNLYKYRLGTFKSYQEARRYRRQLLPKYEDAFVQALRNGKAVSIEQALK